VVGDGVVSQEVEVEGDVVRVLESGHVLQPVDAEGPVRERVEVQRLLGGPHDESRGRADDAPVVVLPDGPRLEIRLRPVVVAVVVEPGRVVGVVVLARQLDGEPQARLRVEQAAPRERADPVAVGPRVAGEPDPIVTR
jgi:hypothetical protein